MLGCKVGKTVKNAAWMINSITDAPALPKDNDEDEETRLDFAPAYSVRQDGTLNPHARNSTSAVANYLFGSSGVLDKPAWSDYTMGRAAIRLVSRGIVGAAFFALGGHYAAKKMRNYEPELWRETGGWGSNFLRTIAKGIDVGPGRIIEGIFRDPQAVRFRVRNQFHNESYFNQHYGPERHPTLYHEGKLRDGRSLGAEIVIVTFDFFMASIGDALTRNIIQAFDPHIRQPWYLDENGNPTTRAHGTFNFSKWLQWAGQSAWRILSKNAGEDWAAALPYVYQMKWQRRAINHIGSDPNGWLNRHGLSGAGFKRSSDSNINGALVTLNDNGEVCRSLQWHGALDLHARFVGYNWYTLMYREMYDVIGKAINDWRKSGFHISMPHLGNPIIAALNAAMFTARYITKSFIKANIYMQPAMFFFWPMRVSQSAWRGQYEMEVPQGHPAYNPDKRMFGTLRTQDGVVYPRAQLLHDTRWPMGSAAPDAYLKGQKIFTGTSENPTFFKNIRDPYSYAKQGNYGRMFGVMDFLGRFSYNSGTWLTQKVDRYLGAPGALSRSIMQGSADAGNLALGREKLLRNFVDASYSYTPYMWAKAETALRVDDRKSGNELGMMDKAIYSLMGNVARLRFGDAWKDVRQIHHLALHDERDIISREGGRELETSAKQANSPKEEVTTATPAPKAPATVIDARSIHRIPPEEIAKETKKPGKETNDNFRTANDNGTKPWARAVNEKPGTRQQQAVG